jgi:hypothetical protein
VPVDIVGLLTTVTVAYERVSMHAVRQTLLRQQAEAAGLPLHGFHNVHQRVHVQEVWGSRTNTSISWRRNHSPPLPAYDWEPATGL